MYIQKNFSDCPKLLNILHKYKIKFDVLYDVDKNVCVLDRLQIPDEYRFIHIGTKVLELFVEWLDTNEYDCELLASDKLGTPLDILYNFYSKFGFNEVMADINGTGGILMKRNCL